MRGEKEHATTLEKPSPFSYYLTPTTAERARPVLAIRGTASRAGRRSVGGGVTLPIRVATKVRRAVATAARRRRALVGRAASGRGLPATAAGGTGRRLCPRGALAATGSAVLTTAPAGRTTLGTESGRQVATTSGSLGLSSSRSSRSGSFRCSGCAAGSESCSLALAPRRLVASKSEAWRTA